MPERKRKPRIPKTLKDDVFVHRIHDGEHEKFIARYVGRTLEALHLTGAMNQCTNAGTAVLSIPWDEVARWGSIDWLPNWGKGVTKIAD